MARNAAVEVQTYEAAVVDKFNALDLYRTKGKSRSKISFNDLSLEENLNYIKHTLKTSDDAFKLFEITKEKFKSTPDISCAIVQKLATRSNINPKNFDKVVF